MRVAHMVRFSRRGSSEKRDRRSWPSQAGCYVRWKRHGVAFAAGGSALRLAERVPAKAKRYENAAAARFPRRQVWSEPGGHAC